MEVWRDRCEARALGDAPARWLSRFLGVPCTLVYMPDATIRATDPRAAPAASGSPTPIRSCSPRRTSLRELARRGADVPMERFRPNIVVDGAPPFAEDGWTRLRIGPVAFRVTKACVRCSVTTVDPAVGAVAGPEPLRTLSTFRRDGDGVRFGVNLVHDGIGAIAVGDAVELDA